MILTYVIWGITIGMCIAAVYLYFIKKICGGFVSVLTSNDCIGEENAKSCDEMGIDKPGTYLKKQLGENGGMSKMVKTTAENKYYIPEEYVTLANKKYRNETIPVVALVGLIVLILATGALASYLAPIIVDNVGELF